MPSCGRAGAQSGNGRRGTGAGPRRAGPLPVCPSRILAPRPGLYELATDDTIVCRCEEVSAGEIRVAIEEGARQVTEVRAVTRAGMGLCQGRLCVPTVTGLLARWAGVTPERPGACRHGYPRPVPIPVLADPVLESVTAPALDAGRR